MGEKNSYFMLRNDRVKFVFPEPGPIEGVKSKGRALLKMTNVTFTYPTKSEPTVFDINLSACMLSHVAVIGANGAGKSTAIKLFVGEMKPGQGQIWKASGLRMAYVAQHAFHHLEKHLNKTPTQYIMWRFAGNDDAESLEFKNTEASADEEKLRAVPWCIDAKSLEMRRCDMSDTKEGKADRATAVTPEAILNRRKNKDKKYAYQTKWFGKPADGAAWVERDTLIAMGYLKLVQREGEVVGNDVALDKAGDGPDEVFDGAGNKIDVKRQATLSDKDKKKKIKDIEKKLKEHKKKACLSDDEMWEIMDELEKLKSEFEKVSTSSVFH